MDSMLTQNGKYSRMMLKLEYCITAKRVINMLVNHLYLKWTCILYLQNQQGEPIFKAKKSLMTK